MYLPLLISPAKANHSPNAPANPSPADQATGQAVTNLTLSWSGADPDGDRVTYSIYLDANSSNPTSLVSADQIATQYKVSSLLPATSYSWKVVAKDSKGATTSGPVWRFTTIPVEPLPIQSQSIAAGANHTCALTQTGAAKCWGDDTIFQLGVGGGGMSPTPVDVVGLASGVSAIAAGGYHTCALTQTGAAMCWGRNNVGQLGTSSYFYALTPGVVVGFP